jgi:hypothetical protein
VLIGCLSSGRGLRFPTAEDELVSIRNGAGPRRRLASVYDSAYSAE